MKNIFKVIAVGLFVSFALPVSESLAYWHHHDHVDVSFGFWGGGPYYDPYYYPYYYDYPAYTYVQPATVVVSSPEFQPVVVNGRAYYVNNGVYYVYTANGYQAVATPAGASAPVNTAVAPSGPETLDSITVNVPNKNGGYTPVVLKKSGNGYVGPQGEYYSEFPKVSQLQTMYGK